jgi:poly [ADP-ribose] polymerase
MPTVAELRAELAAIGEDTSGLKADLVARLAEANKKRKPIDLDADDDQESKKVKVGAAAWFWASDKSPTEREWTPYPPDVTAALEAALKAGAKEEKISDYHRVDLSGSGPASSSVLHFFQYRLDNAKLQRPVCRMANGDPPAQPPPKPAHLPGGGTKSMGAAAAPTAKALAPPPPAMATGGSAVVGAKSVKAGGVSQVRYTSTGGGSSDGVRTEVVKGRAAVDASCPHANACHVYDDGKNVFDALLNQTDIGQNKNKYYIIQLLETDATPPQYYTWNRWGRVGEERNLQNACRGPMGLGPAKKDFESKFHDKTKNKWQERHDFEPVAGKYTLIERDYGTEDGAEDAAKTSAAASSDAPALAPPKPVESKLDPRVQSFVAQIADIRMMERTMREIGFDPAKMPLGKLKKKTILDGYEALRELGEVIRSNGGAVAGGASGKQLAGKSMGAVDVDASSPAYKQIVELSNRFYSVIPHTTEKRQRLPPIETAQMLKDKIDMLEALGEIELASRVIDTKGLGCDVHPVDARYAQLKAQLTPIDKGSPLHALLNRYLQNTHASTHNTYSLVLEQAFEIEREGEAARFTSAIGNRQLLWHGSRLTNWCGIISQGLRIAPPEAPSTGYMFGKGVYFADMSSKSANYCFASRQEPAAVMLLSEVALGQQYVRIAAEYEAEKSCRKAKADSTWGQGRTAPDPSEDTTLPGEPHVKVPLGKGAKNTVLGDQPTSLLYNEFIVYDTSQVRQRYVLQVKFDFT